MTTYLYEATAEARLRALLEARGCELTSAPYAYFTARVPGCVITFYHSGKLLIQGKTAEEWDDVLAPHHVLGASGERRFAAALAHLPEPEARRWIGSDESGKGDYFGPLVTCAVRVEREQLDLLAELGVADSKTLSDRQVHALAPGLKAVVAYQQVVLRPERYNELYDRMGRNLNKLLAWTHARAIEDVLDRDGEVTIAVIDRFGPEQRIRAALLERGRALRVVQRPRAEDDPAVAVASVLARNEFLWQLRALEKEFGVKLAKGAGPPVLAAGRRFVATHGVDALGKVAKLHFKTTETFVDGGRR
jgi:ribonuclease HIII